MLGGSVVILLGVQLLAAGEVLVATQLRQGILIIRLVGGGGHLLVGGHSFSGVRVCAQGCSASQDTRLGWFATEDKTKLLRIFGWATQNLKSRAHCPPKHASSKERRTKPLGDFRNLEFVANPMISPGKHLGHSEVVCCAE